MATERVIVHLPEGFDPGRHMVALEDFAVFSPRLAEAACEDGLTLHGPALGDIYDELAQT